MIAPLAFAAGPELQVSFCPVCRELHCGRAVIFLARNQPARCTHPDDPIRIPWPYNADDEEERR